MRVELLEAELARIKQRNEERRYHLRLSSYFTARERARVMWVLCPRAWLRLLRAWKMWTTRPARSRLPSLPVATQRSALCALRGLLSGWCAWIEALASQAEGGEGRAQLRQVLIERGRRFRLERALCLWEQRVRRERLAAGWVCLRRASGGGGGLLRRLLTGLRRQGLRRSLARAWHRWSHSLPCGERESRHFPLSPSLPYRPSLPSTSLLSLHCGADSPGSLDSVGPTPWLTPQLRRRLAFWFALSLKAARTRRAYFLTCASLALRRWVVCLNRRERTREGRRVTRIHCKAEQAFSRNLHHRLCEAWKGWKGTAVLGPRLLYKSIRVVVRRAWEGWRKRLREGEGVGRLMHAGRRCVEWRRKRWAWRVVRGECTYMKGRGEREGRVKRAIRSRRLARALGCWGLDAEEEGRRGVVLTTAREVRRRRLLYRSLGRWEEVAIHRGKVKRPPRAFRGGGREGEVRRLFGSWAIFMRALWRRRRFQTVSLPPHRRLRGVLILWQRRAASRKLALFAFREKLRLHSGRQQRQSRREWARGERGGSEGEGSAGAFSARSRRRRQLLRVLPQPEDHRICLAFERWTLMLRRDFASPYDETAVLPTRARSRSGWRRRRMHALLLLLGCEDPCVSQLSKAWSMWSRHVTARREDRLWATPELGERMREGAATSRRLRSAWASWRTSHDSLCALRAVATLAGACLARRRLSGWWGRALLHTSQAASRKHVLLSLVGRTPAQHLHGAFVLWRHVAHLRMRWLRLQGRVAHRRLMGSLLSWQLLAARRIRMLRRLLSGLRRVASMREVRRVWALWRAAARLRKAWEQRLSFARGRGGRHQLRHAWRVWGSEVEVGWIQSVRVPRAVCRLAELRCSSAWKVWRAIVIRGLYCRSHGILMAYGRLHRACNQPPHPVASAAERWIEPSLLAIESASAYCDEQRGSFRPISPSSHLRSYKAFLLREAAGATSRAVLQDVAFRWAMLAALTRCFSVWGQRVEARHSLLAALSRMRASIPFRRAWLAWNSLRSELASEVHQIGKAEIRVRLARLRIWRAWRLWRSSCDGWAQRRRRLSAQLAKCALARAWNLWQSVHRRGGDERREAHLALERKLRSSWAEATAAGFDWARQLHNHKRHARPPEPLARAWAIWWRVTAAHYTMLRRLLVGLRRAAMRRSLDRCWAKWRDLSTSQRGVRAAAIRVGHLHTRRAWGAWLLACVTQADYEHDIRYASGRIGRLRIRRAWKLCLREAIRSAEMRRLMHTAEMQFGHRFLSTADTVDLRVADWMTRDLQYRVR
ncbi:MAG: hypothetical protein SGPRY_001728 [Prymnesium sp.]